MSEAEDRRRIRYGTNGRFKRQPVNMGRKDRDRRRKALLRRDGNNCRWCGEPFTDAAPPSFDHIVPRRKGGGDDLANLVLAHRICNERRSNPPLGRRRTAEDG